MQLLAQVARYAVERADLVVLGRKQQLEMGTNLLFNDWLAVPLNEALGIRYGPGID